MKGSPPSVARLKLGTSAAGVEDAHRSRLVLTQAELFDERAVALEVACAAGSPGSAGGARPASAGRGGSGGLCFCSRRCSVRWLMRSVRSATWTLVLPVSRSLAPNLAAISRFRSVVSVIGGATVADALGARTRSATEAGVRLRQPAAHIARAGDVAVHLLDQRLDAWRSAARRAGGAGSPGAARCRTGRRRSRSGTPRSARRGRCEGRAHPDVDGGWHGRWRGTRRRRGRDIRAPRRGSGWRSGSRASRPRSSPRTTSPAQLERGAEEARRLIDLAGQHEAADVTGGDDLPVHLQQRVHRRLKAPVGRQQRGVALRAVAEAEVLADRHPASPRARRRAPRR